MSGENFEIKVTDRGLSPVLEDIPEFGQFRELAHGATILNVGSGLRQRLESDIMAERPDITVLSVDPTVHIDFGEIESNRVGVHHDSLRDPNLAYYSRPPIQGSLTAEEASNFQRLRLMQLANGEFTIDTQAPDLAGIPDESVDMGIDYIGGYMFLLREYYKSRSRSSLNDLTEYLYNISRVLKDGGRMFLIGDLPNGVAIPKTLRLVQVGQDEETKYILIEKTPNYIEE